MVFMETFQFLSVSSFFKMLLSYLKYKLKSQGKFRLHSPFVFDFYVHVLDHLTHDNWRDELYNRLNVFALAKKDVLADVHDNIIVMEDIHSSRKSEKEWNEKVDDDSVKLTVDCYYFGLIFVMERKEKQHFILKF